MRLLFVFLGCCFIFSINMHGQSITQKKKLSQENYFALLGDIAYPGTAEINLSFSSDMLNNKPTFTQEYYRKKIDSINLAMSNMNDDTLLLSAKIESLGYQKRSPQKIAQTDDAIDELSLKMGEYRDMAEVLKKLSNLYLSKNDYENAFQSIESAIAIKPKNIEYLARKGEILMLVGQYQRTKEVLVEVFNRDISHQQSHLNFFFAQMYEMIISLQNGEELLSTQDYYDYQYLDAAIAKFPNEPFFTHLKKTIELSSIFYINMIRYVKSDPEAKKISLGKFITQQQKSALVQLNEYFLNASNTTLNKVSLAYTCMAVIAMLNEDNEKAYALFRKARDIEPQVAYVHYNLIFCEFLLEMSKEVPASIDAKVRATEEKAVIDHLLLINWLREKTSNPNEEIRKAIDEAISQYPNDLDLMFCDVYWNMVNDYDNPKISESLKYLLYYQPDSKKFKYTAGVYALYTGNAQLAHQCFSTLEDEDSKYLLNEYLEVK